MKAWPSVAVIILNWNRKGDTLACLESLSRVDYSGIEMILVDNGSSDGSAGAVRAAFPAVAVLETGENLGFAEGNNVGLRYALSGGADYVLLLNNDTEVAPDLVAVMVDAVEHAPRAGVAGPTIYYHDLPSTIWSAGGIIDWRRGDSRLIGVGEVDEGQYAVVRDVDFVTGCALLAQRRVFEQVGLLDPRFFMYYEETEWCARATRAGYRILHIPQAHVWHKISPMQQAESPRVHYYMTRNRLLFLRNSHAGIQAWVYTLLVDYLRTLVSWSVRPKWRAKRGRNVRGQGALRQAMLQAILDAVVGRWGKSAAPWLVGG